MSHSLLLEKKLMFDSKIETEVTFQNKYNTEFEMWNWQEVIGIWTIPKIRMKNNLEYELKDEKKLLSKIRVYRLNKV